MLVSYVALSAVVTGAGSKPEAPLPIDGEIGCTSCSCGACDAAGLLLHHLKGWACPLCFRQCDYPGLIIFNCAAEWHQIIVMRLVYTWSQWAASPLSFLFVYSFRLWKPTWHPRTVTGSTPMRWGQTHTRTNTEENSLLLCHLKFRLILVCFHFLLSIWEIELLFSISSLSLFDGFSAPFLLGSTAHDPNCTNEEFDELNLLADHFLLLVVDINVNTHSDLLIFLDIKKKKKKHFEGESTPTTMNLFSLTWIVSFANKH